MLVQCLASNDHGNGVKFLKKALVIMESICRDDGNDDVILVNPTQPSTHQPFVEIPGMGHDTFFVFNRALVLKPAAKLLLNTDLVFLNAVIIFNLALSFHQRGHVPGQESKLRKALQLYSVVVKLIEDIPTPTHGAFLAVVMNNQTHIHRELCDFQMAYAVLEDIQMLTEYIPSTVDSATSAFSVALFDEIYLNVTLWCRMPTTAAPA